MIVVALDTATESVALAVARVGEGEPRLLAGGHRIAPRQANSLLTPWLSEALAEAGVRACDVDLVVAGRGPGSFTGVRIGVAAAKGFAQGVGAALAGVGTLDAIAHGHRGHRGLLGVVGDAMRGEVYPALFRIGDGAVERVGPDRVEKPQEAARIWAESTDGPLLLAGNGLAKHAEVFVDALAGRAAIAPEESWWPTADGLLSAYLGLPSAEQGGADPGVLLPVYTRLSDAEETERARLGLASGEVPPSGVDGGHS